jgi:hypothetical protein
MATAGQQNALIIDAQQRIFNELCTAYRRSLDRGIPAEKIRNKLGLSEAFFREALANFRDASGARIVIFFEQNGIGLVGLGEAAESNMRDWRKKPSRRDA